MDIMLEELPVTVPASPMLAHLAGLVTRYADPDFSVAHGGHVQAIAAGHYTVSGMSLQVRLGEFVAHRSATCQRLSGAFASA